jgi:hypothetical protein
MLHTMITAKQQSDVTSAQGLTKKKKHHLSTNYTNYATILLRFCYDE